MFEISSDESESVVDMLGVSESNALVDRTNGIFRDLFVKTGWVEASARAVASSNDSVIKSGVVDTFVARWVDNIWLIAYRAVYRIEVMKIWMVGIGVLCIAMFNDGIVKRKIRVSQARTRSPVSFHLATHALTLVLGAMLTVMTIPMSIYASLWTWVALTLSFLCWKMAESYQSGGN